MKEEYEILYVSVCLLALIWSRKTLKKKQGGIHREAAAGIWSKEQRELRDA